MSETENIVSRFCGRTLPASEWTHFAHLRVGLWHLLHYTPEDALDRLREGIRRYNESTGGLNSDTAGYHETITAFYVRLIANFVATVDRKRPIDELAEALIAQFGDKKLPLNYWSEARLMSPEARRAWVEPDLRPVPGAFRSAVSSTADG